MPDWGAIVSIGFGQKQRNFSRAAAALVAGTAVSPAAAASASTGSLPAACDSAAKKLVAHSSIQGAVKADRDTFIGFTCLGDLVTVEA